MRILRAGAGEQNMKASLLIWDFDGTVLPSTPYDSEQTLLMSMIGASPASTCDCRTPAAADRRVSPIRRFLTPWIVGADQKELGRTLFRSYLGWFIKGTPVATLDEVCLRLAERISSADRQALHTLSDLGLEMWIVSCGTADLSERVIRMAGLERCFSLVEGNRFVIEAGRVVGVISRVPDPQTKLSLVKARGLAPAEVAAVGDGYTDLPLLDWAGTSFLMDRDGTRRDKYRQKGYRSIRSIPDVLELLR